MEGIIITIGKEELENIISRAVETALFEAGVLPEQNEPQDEDEFIMKTQDLCKYLKMKLSTLYQLTHKKKIPFNKRGKTIYFKKDEIDKWISEGKQETIVDQNHARELRIHLADKKRFKTIA